MTNKPLRYNLTIELPSPEARETFASWLCNSGEQHYQDWMTYDIDSGEPVTFHYHGIEDETLEKNDPKRYGTFLVDNIIRTNIL